MHDTFSIIGLTDDQIINLKASKRANSPKQILGTSAGRLAQKWTYNALIGFAKALVQNDTNAMEIREAEYQKGIDALRILGCTTVLTLRDFLKITYVKDTNTLELEVCPISTFKAAFCCTLVESAVLSQTNYRHPFPKSPRVESTKRPMASIIEDLNTLPIDVIYAALAARGMKVVTSQDEKPSEVKSTLEPTVG